MNWQIRYFPTNVRKTNVLFNVKKHKKTKHNSCLNKPTNTRVPFPHGKHHNIKSIERTNTNDKYINQKHMHHCHMKERRAHAFFIMNNLNWLKNSNTELEVSR